ncbi:MAG: potassium transporter [Gammaproteobacteria bacterium]|nr:potassium transporter [Gammaproteobacteria bacterium]
MSERTDRPEAESNSTWEESPGFAPPRPETGWNPWQARQRRAPIKTTLYMVGVLMVLFSVTLLPPIAVAWWYDGMAVVMPFAETLAATLGLGLLCWLPVCRFKVDLRNRDGFVVVVAFWVLLSLLGAIPFVLAEHPHMRVVDAVFETASGLTTTGATILSDLDALPKAILYYRAQLNLLGGMGWWCWRWRCCRCWASAGCSSTRPETPGPMKDEKLTPRITETAKNLWVIYFGLNVACALSFWLAGMSPFDAVCHSFSTLALGGFSTHDASIGYFHSLPIELISGVFTLIAAVNFALFFMAWRRRSLWLVFQDAEFQFFLVVIGGIVALTCAYLYFSDTFPLVDSLVHGFFQSLSIVTSNGHTSAGYSADWPFFVPLLLLLGSFFGGCVGSTCGGIKAVRFLLLYKQSVREIRLLIRPTAQIAVKLGNRPIQDRVMQAVWGFYYLYIFCYCALSLALVATGLDLVTAFGSAAAGLNNMGVGLGDTASNFSPLSDTATVLMTIAMVVGRLEVFPVLLLFHSDFWKG